MLQNYAGLEPYTEDIETDGIAISSDDTLLANIRPYLKKVWKSEFNGACSTDVLAFSPEQINSDFLYSLIAQDKFIDYVMSGAKGSKMPRGDKSHIMDYTTSIPTEDEQYKISSFIELINKRIAAQTCYIEHLKKYKRGVSNAIFAEADTWEQLPFLKVFSTVSDKPYQVTTSEYYDSGSYEVVDQGKKDIVGYNSDESRVFSSLPIIVYGDHTTIIKYRNTPFIIGGDGVKLLTTHTQNDLQYLYYALNQYNIQPEGYKRHFSIVKSLYIPLPSVEQQHIIAQTLATIDLKIRKEADILEQLLLQKKALLQKLFI
jgi:type I restriction enzyme S subunit